MKGNTWAHDSWIIPKINKAAKGQRKKDKKMYYLTNSPLSQFNTNYWLAFEAETDEHTQNGPDLT